MLTLCGSYNFTAIRHPKLTVATCGGCTRFDPKGPTAGSALIDGNPLPQAPMVIGGLQLAYSWGNEKYEASVFGRNITNRIQWVGGLDVNNLTGLVTDYNPRTIGFLFRAHALCSRPVHAAEPEDEFRISSAFLQAPFPTLRGC